MIRNKQIVEELQQEYNSKCEALLKEKFPGGVPKELYCGRPGQGDGVYAVTETLFCGISFYFHKRPNEGDISNLRKEVKDHKYSLHDIRFILCSKSDGYRNNICAEWINVAGGSWFTSMDNAVAAREPYIPKEGYIACAYCGKYRKPEDIIEREISYISNGGIERKVNKYCKDSPCGGYDQMGHEG